MILQDCSGLKFTVYFYFSVLHKFTIMLEIFVILYVCCIDQRLFAESIHIIAHRHQSNLLIQSIDTQ